jgi:hypothetical protein
MGPLHPVEHVSHKLSAYADLEAVVRLRLNFEKISWPEALCLQVDESVIKFTQGRFWAIVNPQYEPFIRFGRQAPVRRDAGVRGGCQLNLSTAHDIQRLT